MIDREHVERRLRRLIEATPGEQISIGYWVGDKASERQVIDNLRSGRLEWQAARNKAIRALKALEAGDLELAEVGLRDAEGCRAAAIEKQLRPSDYLPLLQDAKQRGSKGQTDRDARLAKAVSKQEALGLKGKAARRTAIEADPVLAMEFRGMGDAGIRAAIRRGQKAKL